MTDNAQDAVFNPGQADWVREKATDDLDRDQRALLLAMAQLEAATGHVLSPEERAALESLAGQLEGFDPQEIKAAIARMVNQPADPERKTTWAELKDRLHP